jgi:D-beta-D-heptose 7-phosphate kinase/D-beta-D-heptose 1-phosphate adenosyltransferase
MNNFQERNNTVSWEGAMKRVQKARQAGQRIAFTNGCFDILHAGHVRYLTAARAAADILVVGLNSDASVRIIKGDRRPLNPETLRAEVLAGLRCVDCVVLFEEPDPLALIQALQPDVLVKGADWAEDRIIGADLVKQRGGRVERIDLVPDISTSALIDRIRERYC